MKEAASPSQKSRSTGDGHFPDNLKNFVDHYFFGILFSLIVPAKYGC